jgi:tetratricopeptide (TPR) repeat protein
MPEPPAFLRAYAGLEARSGRTIVLAGPPTSGKSQRLEELKTELEARKVAVLTTEGSYRDRDHDYGALNALWSQWAEKIDESREGIPSLIPGALVGVLGGEGLPSMGGRRRSRGGRGGFASPPRTGTGGFESMAAVWASFTERFRTGRSMALALLIEDATLLDSASRTLLLQLSRLARRRPFLLVLELDNSLPSFREWEEELLGRTDVDWIRLSHPHADARETDRLQEILASLPAETRRIVGFVALLDGATAEVVLARIVRRRTSELHELVQPALSANLLKAGDGRIAVAHESWVDHLIESIPGDERREMYRIVAEGLEALSPEPNLQRRFQIAEQYFRAGAGPLALRHLVEAAHLAERVLAFDPAEAAIAKAIECIPPAPEPALAEMAVELRLERAKLLAYGGRPAEAESAIREAVEEAVLRPPSAGRLEELLLAMAQVVYTVGPRDPLRQSLSDAADRFQKLRWSGPEAIARVLLAYVELLGTRIVKAESEVSKAYPLSEGPGTEIARIAALLFDAVVQLWSQDRSPPGVPQTLETIRQLLRGSHLTDLDLFTTAVEARWTQGQAGAAAALRVIDRGLVVAERTGALWLELHLLTQRVGLLLGSETPAAGLASLQRCEYLTETLHVVPPGPALFRVWGFAARIAQQAGRFEEAREFWLDILAHGGYCQLPRTRALALLRLAHLDIEMQTLDRARVRIDQLREEKLESYLPTTLSDDLHRLDSSVPAASNERAGR